MRTFFLRYGPGGILVAVLAAFIGGFLAASLANRLAWEHAPDMPSAAERAEITALVAPGLPIEWVDWEPADPDVPFASLGGELTARHISAHHDGTPETERVTAYMDGVRERLRQAGWTVVADYSTSPTTIATGEVVNESRALTARNDRFALDFEDHYEPEFDESFLRMQVNRVEPAWFAWVTVAAGVAGAILAVPLALWAGRRVRDEPVARIAAAGTFLLGLLLFLPIVALGVIYLETFSGVYTASQPLWTGLDPGHEFGGLAVPCLTLLALSFVIALLGPLVTRVRLARRD